MELAKIDGIAGFVTVEAAAKRLGLTSDAIVKIIRRHDVNYIRVGRSILVRPSDLTLERKEGVA